VAFSPDGKFIAVGFMTGEFTVLDGVSLAEVVSKRDRKEEISDLKYSPNNSLLAVGSHNNFIDIYNASKRYERLATCKGHSSFITHLDWSLDSQYIQSNCGAYELLFWNSTTGAQIKSISTMKDVRWATQTCVIGWSVQGVIPPGDDGSDVNSVARTNNNYNTAGIIVSGDDHRFVNLYRYPCLEDAKGKKFGGHSEHVTNVCFTYDDRHVISTGGADLCVFQWKVVKPGQDIRGAYSARNTHEQEQSEGDDEEYI